MRTWLKLIFFNLACFVLFRLVFLGYFNEQANGLTFSNLLHAFYLGTKFDLRLALALALPLILLSNLPFLNFRKTAFANSFWINTYTVIAAAWMLFYLVDFGYFEYLDARINGTALHFLKNPWISSQMVWQTYSVPLWLMGFAALIVAYRFVLRKIIFVDPAGLILDIKEPLKRKFLRGFAFFLFFVAGAYGKFSYYPLRWSEAYSQSHHFAAALGLNPMLYFFDTLKFKNNAIDQNKVEKYYEDFAEYLNVKNIGNLNFRRHVEASKNWDSPPNIILVVMESLASHRTNLMQNPVGPTPELEKMAKQSYLFSEYFASSEGTARSMFSLVTGVPDVSTVKTASRNPFFVDQRIVMNTFNGYKKIYMIGGSANWANIRAVFSNNIEGLEVIEEGHYEEPRADVWGLSDYHLFKEAVKKLKGENGPFFAYIQAASFHRPYSIPDDRGDFKEKPATKEKLEQSGFESLAEYNSLRFSDYALGYFFDELKKLPQYENTIFVVTGDHGLPENQSNFFPKQRRFYQMEKFHVPLVIHSPKLFPEGVVDPKPASSVDVMTSLASLAGVSHPNYTLGRDLFAEELDSERYAFTYTYYNPNRPFSLIAKDFVLLTNARGESTFHHRNSENPTADVKDQFPERYDRMSKIAKGYLYSAEYLLRNNKKKVNFSAKNP